jgi:hypothetical protein
MRRENGANRRFGVTSEAKESAAGIFFGKRVEERPSAISGQAKQKLTECFGATSNCVL